MKVTLRDDWTLKATNGSDVVVPKGTEIDLPEAADESHALEVAVGAKIPIVTPTAPVAPATEPEDEEAPKHKGTKAKPRAVKAHAKTAKAK